MYGQFRALALKWCPENIYYAQLIIRRRSLWRKVGLIFVHVPKNGGTSVNQLLYGQFMGHIPAHAIEHAFFGAPSGIEKFAIIRNPWSRCLSAYNYLKRECNNKLEGRESKIHFKDEYLHRDFDTFESFVTQWLTNTVLSKSDPIFRTQISYTHDINKKLLVDRIFRLENVLELNDYLSDKTGGDVCLPYLNVAKQKIDYREFYTHETASIVGQIYKDDVDRFGYSFDEE